MSRIERVFGKALVGAALALSVALPLGAAATGLPRDVIYNFTCGPDGAIPYAGLIRDAAGNFYGTTAAAFCAGGGVGAVFKLSPLGAATALYIFTGGSDGGIPRGKLIADAAGNLYGTTSGGGTHGQGVVFKLTPGGVETVLHSFAGAPNDGSEPICGLVMDGAGNIYGTTTIGGAISEGTVFKLAPDGTETVLHSFTGEVDGVDGYDPTGDLVMDKSGALYGNTYSNGPSTIFKIAANGDYSVLHTFRLGGAGGDCVYGGVIIDRHGALYGTTTSNCRSAPVVFKITPNGKETVLHTFTGADGVGSQASLTMDKQGNLFGTSAAGGRFNRGTVFQISPDGTATVLHSFAYTRDDPPDGMEPLGGLVLYMNKLYGTTFHGGTRTDGVCRFGCGAVFEVKRAK